LECYPFSSRISAHHLVVSALTTQVTVTTNAGDGTIALSGKGIATIPIQVSVSPSSATLVNTYTQQFTATGKYADGSSHDITNVAVWSSSDSNTVVVTSSGLATGVAAGIGTITATLASVSGSAQVTESTAQLAPNGTDPLLFEAKAGTGEVTEFFGLKNDQGIPTNVTSYAVNAPSGSVATLLLDNQRRPVEVQTGDGSTFLIAWKSQTSATITAISPDGSARVIVNVDSANQTAAREVLLSRSQKTGVSETRSVPCRTAIAAGSGPSARSHRSTELALMSPTNRAAGMNATTSSSTVTVTECGSPADDAIVSVDYILSETKFSISGLAMGGGKYSVAIPVPGDRP
jgi:hypothetical protein